SGSSTVKNQNGFGWPKDTIGDLAQRGNVSGAADDAQLAFRLAAEHVNEQRRLQAGERSGLGKHRDADEKREIDTQTPERRVHERIEISESEQGIGLQPFKAEKSMFDDAGGHQEET